MDTCPTCYNELRPDSQGGMYCLYCQVVKAGSILDKQIEEALHMTNDFSSFLKENVEKVGTKEIPLKRYKDPIIIRAVGSEEADVIQKRCEKNRAGKDGKQERYLDTTLYNAEFNVASIIQPDLHNKKLQENYEVMGAVALYHRMFTSGEALAILEATSAHSGIGTSLKELVDEVKN